MNTALLLDELRRAAAPRAGAVLLIVAAALVGRAQAQQAPAGAPEQTADNLPVDPFAPEPPPVARQVDPPAGPTETNSSASPSPSPPPGTLSEPPSAQPAPTSVPRTDPFRAPPRVAAPPAAPAPPAATAREVERLETQARERELEAGILRDRAQDLRNPPPQSATRSTRRPASPGVMFRYAGAEFYSFQEFRESPEWRMMKFDLRERQRQAEIRRTAAQEVRRKAIEFEREWRKLSPVARYFSGL